MNGEYISHGGGLITWRMPKTDEDFEYLKAMGVRRIVSLVSKFLEHWDHDIENERTQCELHGFEFESEAILPIFPPSKARVERILNEAIIFWAPYKTLVHCRQSCDRTGVVVFGSLRKSYSFSQSLKFIQDHGFHRRYFWWIPILWFRYPR